MKKLFIKPHNHYYGTLVFGSATDLATGNWIYASYKEKCSICGKVRKFEERRNENEKERTERHI